MRKNVSIVFMLSALGAIVFINIFISPTSPCYFPLLFGILPIFAISIILQIFGGHGQSDLFWGKTKEARRILETGLTGRATVQSLGHYGRFLSIRTNRQPELKLGLTIQPEGASSYDLLLPLIIPEFAIPRFQPGTVFYVKIDRSNPGAIVYDGS